MFLLDERLTLVSHTADFSVAVDLYHAFLVNYFVTSYQHISSEVVLLAAEQILSLCSRMWFSRVDVLSFKKIQPLLRCVRLFNVALSLEKVMQFV